MEYKRKYIKYKCKYLENQLIGGKYEVGDEKADKLIDSNLTLIMAHGGVNLTKWIIIPNNVYILTTTEIGGITCKNYNEVFEKLVNDTNDRKNLREILNSKPISKESQYTNRIAKTIYKGGYIIYEPNDIIPTIELSFNHTKSEESGKTIYGIFQFEPMIANDTTKNQILSEYDNLLRVKLSKKLTTKTSEVSLPKYKEIIPLERHSDFKINPNEPFDSNEPYKNRIFINQNRLKQLIKIIIRKKINIELAFNKFIVDNKYKKFFAQPNRLKFNEIKDEDDAKFITMIISLYYTKNIDKYDTTIEEVIDKLDKTKINLIVLTSCLHTKNVYVRMYKKKTDIPISINDINNLPSIDKYINDDTLFPIYSVSSYSDFEKFLEIYGNYSEHKDEIKQLIEEKMLFSNYGINFNVLTACIFENYPEVLFLLRNNVNFDDDIFKDILIKLLKSKLNEKNDALIEFFKFKYWLKNNDDLYPQFEQYDKINLWEVLLINGFKFYNNEKSIFNKILFDSINIDIQTRIKFIKLLYENSQYNLLNDIIKEENIQTSYISKNLNELSSIIINNYNEKNNIYILSKLYKNEDTFEIINNLLIENKINLYNIKNEEVTDFFINLSYSDHISENYIIIPLKKIVEDFKHNKIDINYPNKFECNLLSYVISLYESAKIQLIQKNKIELENLKNEYEQQKKRIIEDMKNSLLDEIKYKEEYATIYQLDQSDELEELKKKLEKLNVGEINDDEIYDAELSYLQQKIDQYQMENDERLNNKLSTNLKLIETKLTEIGFIDNGKRIDLSNETSEINEILLKLY